MSPLPFRIEVDTPSNPRAPSGWQTVEQSSSLLYLRGKAEAWAERTPRAAMRIVRHRDGRVMDAWPACDAPEIGAVAGWATAHQLIAAAGKALRQVEASTSGASDEQIAQARAALAALGAS